MKKSEIFLTQKINFKNIYYSGQIRIASSLEWSSFFDRKETMKFPSDFIEKYKDLLGAEAEEFFTSFDQEAVSAYRINPLKKQQKDYPDPIPGTPWGHYGKISGKSSDHATGLVYSQEPAAQMVAQVAAPSKGSRVLDLAAAPGGKSTHLLSYLDNTGLLVSNEINFKRSKVLVENIERFGAKNVVVTNTSADKLAKVFKNYFDMIVFDGPCSGEGMFRKGNNEIKNWQQKGSEPYAKLQREIVDDAIKLLAPGGMLLYSTCTFSPEENEQVIEYLLEKNEDLSLVPMKMCEGFDHGHPEWTLTGREDIKQCIGLWPHKIKGEGHFLALLKKADGEQPTFKYEKIKKVKLTPETEEFFKNCKMDIDWSHVREHQGKLFYLKEDIPEMKKVRVLRKGEKRKIRTESVICSSVGGQ